MQQKVRVAGMFIVAAAAAVSITAGVGGPTTPTTQTTVLKWDVSTGNSIKQVDWPLDVKANEYALDSKEVDIKIDPKRNVNAKVAHVYLSKRGNRLRLITLDFAPESLANATAHATKEMSYWGIGSGELEKWAAAAKTGDLSTFTSEQPVDLEASIVVSLEIPPAVGFGVTEWHVMLKFYWPQTDRDFRRAATQPTTDR